MGWSLIQVQTYRESRANMKSENAAAAIQCGDQEGRQEVKMALFLFFYIACSICNLTEIFFFDHAPAVTRNNEHFKHALTHLFSPIPFKADCKLLSRIQECQLCRLTRSFKQLWTSLNLNGTNWQGRHPHSWCSGYHVYLTCR